MNGAHLHLMLIHFPIAGTILAVPLLATAWRLKNETLKLTGLSMVVVVGLLGYAAFLSGGEAGGIVRNFPNVIKGSIHEHAEAADWAIWFLALNALLSVFGLFTFLKHRKVSQWVFTAVMLLTLFSTTVLLRVAYLGGNIQHIETRDGFPAVEGEPKNLNVDK